MQRRELAQRTIERSGGQSINIRGVVSEPYHATEKLATQAFAENVKAIDGRLPMAPGGKSMGGFHGTGFYDFDYSVLPEFFQHALKSDQLPGDKPNSMVIATRIFESGTTILELDFFRYSSKPQAITTDMVRFFADEKGLLIARSNGQELKIDTDQRLQESLGGKTPKERMDAADFAVKTSEMVMALLDGEFGGKFPMPGAPYNTMTSMPKDEQALRQLYDTTVNDAKASRR